jgi:hypothetical protein
MDPTLPSVRAAEALLLGEPGGVTGVVKWTALRAALIAVGLLAVGQRRGVVKGAVAGALAVEVFVLWEVRRQLKAAGRLARSNGQR